MMRMLESSLAQILQHTANIKILVVGDVMLDHYVWGEVSRISPEAPVPVVHVRKETFTVGGAANVALNLASLGASAKLLSTWGTDEAGLKLDNLLNARGIRFENSVRHNGIETIVKKRIIARTQQLCRIDHEGPTAMYNMASSDCIKRIELAMEKCDAVILSDYGKGVVDQRMVDCLMMTAKKKSIPVAVDPKPTRWLDFKSPWLVTPNRSESLAMAGISEPSHGEPFPLTKVCEQIHKKITPEILIITLGADGMAISEPGKPILQLPTLAKEVFDVSGAGDTVIATLVAASVAGADSRSAAIIANAAAGCVVAHIGTVPVDLQELMKALPTLGNLDS